MSTPMPYRLLFCILFFPAWVNADNQNSNKVLSVGLFSKEDIASITPTGWQPLHFASIEQKTAYFLDRDNDAVVVKAVSNASASGFYNKVDINPQDFPVLSWSWKVKNILQKGDVTIKEGDDYAARIYISFYYDPERLRGTERIKYRLYTLLHDEPPPLAVINYIWANKASVGTFVDNAYSPRVKMIVVESGEKNLNQWQTVTRNIYADYKKAFGEPPGKITAVAIMTDTDNTGESATSWYGDIQFGKSEVK